MTAHATRRGAAHICGDLALYPVAYALGIAILIAHALGAATTLPLLGYIALAAHAGYLLDRVKPRDTRLDPADRMADPARHALLRRFARPLRALMALEWLGAAALGALIHPILAALVPVGIIAALAYAGAPPGRGATRMKDVHALKSVLVATALTGLGAFAALAPDPAAMTRRPLSAGLSILGVWLVVAGDAVICDLDDRASDRAYDTRSLPVLAGPVWSALAALILIASGSAVMILWSTPMPPATRTSIAAMLVFSAALILGSNNRRDWIDARTLPIVLYGLWIGA